MTKDDIALKLERLVGREVKIVDKIKHSSNRIDDYAGMSGILKQFDLGEKDYEDVIALIQIIVATGKKKENRSINEIWVDARDIVEVEEKKVRTKKSSTTTEIKKTATPKKDTTTKTKEKKVEKVVEKKVDEDDDDWEGVYV